MPASLVGRVIRAIYPRVEPELAKLADYFPRGGTAVDVGGWFGPWTQRLLTLADHVVTVEAVPVMADLLRRTFPHAQVIHAAASDQCGQTEIWIPPTGPYTGTSTLRTTSGTPVSVSRITLDSLELENVRFIKMDIEGHELAALHGARQTIERDFPHLLIELESRHQDIAPVLDLLSALGYAGHVLTDDRWTPLDRFDLVGHQQATLHQLQRSLVSRALRPGQRYINSVLFTPA
jgi:FkbM family methyltransferase